MADLIEREALNKWCHETMKAQTTVEGMSYIRTFWDAVNAVPDVDAVPVVRCKECRYSRLDEEYGHRWCNRGMGCREVEFDGIGFCSWGERRNDDAAD